METTIIDKHEFECGWQTMESNGSVFKIIFTDREGQNHCLVFSPMAIQKLFMAVGQ